ncbi:HAD-IA family hydrolase [Nocardioides bigeumensis]|uniref:Hydrolase of the HAD superfamily n=1 Tax=Nocardioides bigeumensis TaxID=433657 RepID=A0ABP5JP86_9ACTN
MSTIRHVLLDADGVLQDLPGGWYAAMEPYLGERAREFLHQSWEDELPMLAGEGEFLPLLEGHLREFGVHSPVEQVFADVWCRIDRIAESFTVVDDLRRAGYGVHLATNQERNRAAHMRHVLGYDDLFDVSCYSYDLGVAKPDPAFFREAARRIDANPAEILFVDDNANNVDGARTAGLAAVHWDFTQGHTVLLGLMEAHGVRTGSVGRPPSSPAPRGSLRST